MLLSLVILCGMTGGLAGTIPGLSVALPGGPFIVITEQRSGSTSFMDYLATTWAATPDSQVCICTCVVNRSKERTLWCQPKYCGVAATAAGSSYLVVSWRGLSYALWC